LLAVGGFDERFRRAEDVELAYRLAKLDLHFVFNPQAIGYHYAERSYQSWLKTPYVYGRNDVIFAREHELPILKAMQEEFEMRNRLTQILVWACLDRPRLSQWAEGLIKALSNQFGGLGKGRLARVCYSAIFNLRYYQGVADEMGNRRRIFAKQG
ncbi:MAG: glycosyltransferase family 2 protein, partial [Chloroflexales bacterium]